MLGDNIVGKLCFVQKWNPSIHGVKDDDEKITKEREKWVNKLIFEYYVKKSKQQAKNNAKKSFFQLK